MREPAKVAGNDVDGLDGSYHTGMGLIAHLTLVHPDPLLDDEEAERLAAEMLPWELDDATRADARQLGLRLSELGLTVEVVEDWDEGSGWMSVRLRPSMTIDVAVESGLLSIEEHTDPAAVMERLPAILAQVERAVNLVPLANQLEALEHQWRASAFGSAS